MTDFSTRRRPFWLHPLHRLTITHSPEGHAFFCLNCGLKLPPVSAERCKALWGKHLREPHLTAEELLAYAEEVFAK